MGQQKAIAAAENHRLEQHLHAPGAAEEGSKEQRDSAGVVVDDGDQAEGAGFGQCVSFPAEATLNQCLLYRRDDRLGRRKRNVASLAARQILELARAGGEFAVAGNDAEPKAAAIGISELLAELFRLREKFDADSCGANRGCEQEIVIEPILIEEGD